MVDAFSMLTTVVVGLYIGVNLDRFYKVSPLFTIALVFLGIAISIYSAIKRANKK